jgi:hypothetical protein
MVDGTLHLRALTYPVISAQNNRKLTLQAKDVLEIAWSTMRYQVVGRRASASDPWTIEVSEGKTDSVFSFEMADVTISTDDLNWKSMADLAIKQHMRLADAKNFSVTSATNPPYAKADASAGSGYTALTAAEMAKIATLEGDDAGNFAMKIDLTQVAGASYCAFTIARAQLGNAIATILANTGTSTEVVTTSLVLDIATPAKARVSTKFTFLDCQGTDAVTVGNYTRGKASLRFEAAPAGGYGNLNGGRILDSGSAISIPSTQLDHIRRASNEGKNPTISFVVGRNEDNLYVESEHGVAPSGGYPDYVSVLDPDSVVEFSFDQANSLNVLAAAAFAGIAGLSAVGAATELKNLLADSVLTPLFQQVAVALGTTTTALITGYVSAIIAAYNNGWIADDQIFDLNQHYQWITNGATYIAAAAGAGLASQGVAGLLSYMGVSSNVIGVALNAVGGAATGAGVALGMSAIMSKVVRHRYWGE